MKQRQNDIIDNIKYYLSLKDADIENKLATTAYLQPIVVAKCTLEKKQRRSQTSSKTTLKLGEFMDDEIIKLLLIFHTIKEIISSPVSEIHFNAARKQNITNKDGDESIQ